VKSSSSFAYVVSFRQISDTDARSEAAVSVRRATRVRR